MVKFQLLLNPDTRSGRASAYRRFKKMQDNGYTGSRAPQIHLYNPKNTDYQPGSSKYIGPKK